MSNEHLFDNSITGSPQALLDRRCDRALTPRASHRTTHVVNRTRREGWELTALLDDAPRGSRRRITRERGTIRTTTKTLGLLLASRGFAEEVSGADLFVLALALADRESLEFERAVDVLVAAGLPEPRRRDRLIDRMAQSVRDRREDYALRRGRGSVHCDNCRNDLLGELLTRPTVRARLARIVEDAERASRTPARPAPPPPEPIAKPSSSPSPFPPPVVDEAPFLAAPVTFGALDRGALDALGGERASLAEVSLALRAHDLAVAEAFEDLLAPSVLVGVTSHAYQLETARRVLRVLRGRALLADEVGLGKTVEAILVLREYQLRGMAKRTLVVCPAALVPMWTGELRAKAGIEARTLDDAAFAADPAAFLAAPGVVVASLSKARTAKNAPMVQAAAWDMVVIDEAHHVKNRTSLAYKLVDGLRSRFLLLLTATPIETDLEEIYNLITLLRPGQFATPSEFRRQFVDKSDPTSPKNRERLRAILGEVMVRNTRARSGLALPPRYVTTACVEPSAPERALYDEIHAMLRRHGADGRARTVAKTLLLEAGSSVAAARATLDRIASSDTHAEALRRDAARARGLAGEALAVSSKGARLVEILREHGGFGLVFSRFRATQDALADLLGREGLRFERFAGGMSTAEKRAAIERFERDRCVLLATDVGGEGQNLQFCDLLVNFDLPWNPMAIEQRIGRLHRMGQKNEVAVWNLCARGTAEERLLDVLDRRLDLFKLVVGEMDMVLGNVEGEELEERLLSLYAEAANDVDLDRGFDALASELLEARTRYAGAKALDESLFGEDFEA
jgi:superfamily II DNA or RNA helicase